MKTLTEYILENTIAEDAFAIMLKTLKSGKVREYYKKFDKNMINMLIRVLEETLETPMSPGWTFSIYNRFSSLCRECEYQWEEEYEDDPPYDWWDIIFYMNDKKLFKSLKIDGEKFDPNSTEEDY